MKPVERVLEMMRLQDSFNESVIPSWKDKNLPWYRAIYIEAVETEDSIGWKWWKHQPFDKEHVILELIDIWHFGLSASINGSHVVNDLEWANIVASLFNRLRGNPPRSGGG